MLAFETRPPYCLAYSFAAFMPALLYAKCRVLPSFVTTLGIILTPMLFAFPLADRRHPKANAPKYGAHVKRLRVVVDPPCFARAVALAQVRAAEAGEAAEARWALKLRRPLCGP